MTHLCLFMNIHVASQTKKRKFTEHSRPIHGYSRSVADEKKRKFTDHSRVIHGHSRSVADEKKIHVPFTPLFAYRRFAAAAARSRSFTTVCSFTCA